MKYEILDEEGNVVNTILAEKAFVDQYHAGKYREVVEIFIPGDPIIIQPTISKLGMMLRFTEGEYMEALRLAKTDVEVEMWMDYMHASQMIDLMSDRVKRGVNTLLAKGVVTADRANAILNDPVKDSERV
jgi:hypothetical protein